MANNKQFVLSHKLPAVSSNEYWLFRKAHITSSEPKGTTHAKFIVSYVGSAMNKSKIEKSPANIWNWIKSNIDTDTVAKLPYAHETRQLLQYLNQLDDKGISAVINKISAWDNN